MTSKNKTNNYYIIDAHAHIYPEKIALKASQAIGDFYHIEMRYAGTSEGLLEEGKSAGVDRYLVHSVATTPGQVRSINNFILSEMKKHPEFIGFITLNPDMTVEDMAIEVDFALENGFKGVKLHPDFQKFYVDGARAEKIYKAVDGRLPILFHAGDKRYGYSKPERLATVARLHPAQKIICAHFGGYSEWSEIDCYDGLKNVYFDTSSSLFELSPEKAVNYVRRFGVEKFFFGTDYPMWNAVEEVERFLKLDLTETERKKIFSENLIEFLHL